ncbi:MAG: peptide deformylase [Planctomycetes bacterium]|nr:peptide deformylase [Planctomycetota bacterium]
MLVPEDDIYLRVYPDPILAKKSQAIEDPCDENILPSAERMLDIMYDHDGIGLAGPQAGIPFRVIVYDLSEGRDQPQVLINPEIVEFSKNKCSEEEGCLSFPEVRSSVERSAQVVVKGFEPNGDEIQIEADELMAAMFQHEIDHLDGISFVDRLGTTGKMRIRKALKDLETDNPL